MTGLGRGLEGSTVMVTGGAGFIGSHLVEALVARGARVTVVDNMSTGRPEHLEAVAERIRIETVDLARADLDELLGDCPSELIFHLAGHVDIRASVEDPAWDLESNGLATFRLLEATRRAAASPGRVILASSAAVYGEGGERLRESGPTRPTAPYGVSKLMAERYVAVYASLYGLETASLRLFPVYGPRLSGHVVSDFIAKIDADPNEMTILGDGRQVRDFVYVTDAVEAFLLVAAVAPLAGETYNVATGEPTSIRRLAMVVAEQMGATPRLRYTGEDRPGVSRRWTADVERISGLGFRSRVSLARGLARTVEWYRAASAGPED